MYYRRLFTGKERVDVDSFEDINLTTEELCNCEMASFIYFGIREGNTLLSGGNVRLQRKVEEIEEDNVSLKRKVAELERELKLVKSYQGAEVVDQALSAGKQGELVTSSPDLSCVLSSAANDDVEEDEIQPGPAKRPRRGE